MDERLLIGDQRWSVDFAGWDQPLWVRGEAEGLLRPWTVADHLAALSVCALGGADGPTLDLGRFAQIVLDRCWSGAASGALDELALWWAAAPGAGEIDPAGWVSLGASRARLRRWSWLERGRALEATVRDEGLDAAALLAAEVESCVVETSDGLSPMALPAGPVLQALVHLNAPPALPPGLGRTTLRAAKALGWSPRQVLEAPAADMDLLLLLLDEAPSTPAAPPIPSGLAAHPDSVTIVFGGGA